MSDGQHLPKVCAAPLLEVVARASDGNKKCRAGRKPCIGKVVSSRRNGEICYASILKHRRIRCRPVPTRKNVIKYHVKPTDREAILGDATLPIPSGLSICCTRAAVDVGTVDCAERVLKKWVELRIVLDFRWGRCVCRW